MRIWIAGHTGLVGQELLQALAGDGQLLTMPRSQLNLLDSDAVGVWLQRNRPDAVVLAAARVGGIAANLADPTGFLVENVAIQNNVLQAAQACGVQRLIFYGSSAMFPASATQPMVEEALYGGPLDAALRPYALAKLAGLELCRALRRQYGFGALCLVPPNLFGAADRFGDGATVLPSLIRRVAEARAMGERTLRVWGTGRARREVLPASELARGTRFFLQMEDARWNSLLDADQGPVLNLGAGSDYSMRELAETVCRALDWSMEIAWDVAKPEGSLRKLLDATRAAQAGWKAEFDLQNAIGQVYDTAKAAGRLT